MRKIPRAVVVVVTPAALGLAAGCSAPVRYAGQPVKEAGAFLGGVEGTWQSDKPAFTFSSSESAEFYQPTTGAGTLTPLTFDVSFEK